MPAFFKAYYKVKKTKFDIEHMMTQLNQNNTKLLLIGTPIHKNLGDHLIALAELQYLTKYFDRDKIVEIPQEVYRVYKTRINKKIETRDYIFVSGGGWMGNVWETDDKFIRNILKYFPNNYKIIFPQTIYFDSSRRNYHRVIRRNKKAYKRAENYMICFREKYSYETAISVLGIEMENCLLVPDIGLLYESNVKSRKQEKIGIVFRDDIEKALDLKEKEEIIVRLFKSGEKIDEFSTISEALIGLQNRKFYVDEIIQKFGNCKYVITDRLHAMIFCVLSNTPCIVFDNLTHKIRGVYETWLAEMPEIYFVKTIDEFWKVVTIIEQRRENNVFMQFEECFNELTELIVSKIKKVGDENG